MTIEEYREKVQYYRRYIVEQVSLAQEANRRAHEAIRELLDLYDLGDSLGYSSIV